MRMRIDRAKRRSQQYLTDTCRIILPTQERDAYGFRSETQVEEVLYDGKCFVSPGNMWPFETGSDVIRGARSDVQVYLPKDVPRMTPECLIEYDNSRYEVIAFASPVTAQATLEVTARRVS